MCKLKFTIVALVLVLLAAPAMAVTYYVAKTGDDGNAGTQGAPWLTIDHAAETVVAGDIVIVSAGTYAEKAVVDNSGTSSLPITFEADISEGDVIIDGTGKDNCFLCSKPYVIIDGFICTGAGGQGIGWTTSSGNNGIIRNCIIYETGGKGINVNSPDNVLIENCLVFDTDSHGILVTGNSEPTTINNCTVDNAGDGGIKCSYSDTTIRDCIVTNSAGYGIDVYGGVAVDIDYSDVWNNSSGNYEDLEKITVGNDCISSDPCYVDSGEGDFNLDTGSPCIGTASDGNDMGFFQEIPNRAPVSDAGADQFALVGDKLTFNGEGSSDPDADSITYQWTFDDNSPPINGLAAKHVFLTGGTHTVTLTVSDGDLNDVDSLTVTVWDESDADYFVAKDGSDSNPGTEAQPFLTINKAASVLTAGEMVIVKSGTYNEKVTTINGGTSLTAPIVYAADSNEGDVVIDMQSLVNNGFVNNGLPYVMLNGFVVQNCTSDGILFKTDTGDNCIIRNCVAKYNDGDGISVTYADDCRIENCLSYNNGSAGMRIIYNADGTIINECTVYNNGADGVVCSASDTTIRDSIIADSADYGVKASLTITVDIDYSDVWSNTDGNYNDLTRIEVGDNCVESDPCFVNAAGGNFRLLEGSPCIDSASDGENMGYEYPSDRPPVADAGPNQPNAKTNVSVSFDGSGSFDPDGDTIVSYNWDFGDGNSDSGVTTSHTYTSEDSYTVTLTVSDGDSNDSDTCVITVQDNLIPVADAGADANGFAGRPVSFDGSGSSDGDGDSLTYLWDFGDDSNAVGQQVEHTYSSDGNYTVTLTVNDGFGGTDDDTCMRYIISNGVPTADAGGDVSAYVGDLVTFDGSGSSDPDGDPLWYGWDFDDGTTGTGVTKTHVFDTNGVYEVTLTVDDGWDGEDTDTCVVTIMDRPVTAPAFPGAEGAGKWTVGGRGGTVYEVTNLNDSGTGSLRAAVQASGARIVVFRVSGTIALQSHLTINNPYITIAGQTAPGEGICLKDYALVVNASEVIVRFLRVRTADNGGEGFDTITAGSGTNIILDHCSASWGVDETLSTTTSGSSLKNVTVQWCMITESLNCSNHPEGCHGMGTLAKGGYGAQYSYHHNLYAHHNSRSPYPGNYNDISVDPNGLTFDFRNNVVYNWGGDFAGYNTQSGANSVTKMNFINNYYKTGPDSNDIDPLAFYERVLASKGYFSGNTMDGNTPADPWDLVLFYDGWTQEQIDTFKQAQQLPVLDMVPTESALVAYSRVLAEAGAILPMRDNVDDRIVYEVENGTGGIIDDEDEVGGWPTLSSDTPPTDSDSDGMPDSWENSNSLDPYDANDGAADADSDGYTNLEEYLNYLVSSSLNNPPDVEAGENQSITLPSSATLDGTVTDDGIPSASVTTLWTKLSGPGTVTFGDDSEIDTTASFSSSGTYVLRLTADDSDLATYDDVIIAVNPEPYVQATIYWDGGLEYTVQGDSYTEGYWEDANNWWSPPNPERSRTLPIFGDIVRLHYITNWDPPNPNSENVNPESHITVDSIGVAEAGKIQTKEYTNSLTVLSGADLRTRGNIEFYQDWTFNVHDLIIYGTVNAGTNTGQVRIGGHQSFSYNNLYVYGALNIRGALGTSALWIGYAVYDNNASIDHNRVYIYSGGVVRCNDFIMMPASDSILDIKSGGKLVVDGNEKDKIDEYVSKGVIVGNGGSASVEVTYYAASNETVVVTAGMPLADAGPDQEIIYPVNSVDLDGTASGTVQWSKHTGPGTVTFGNASAIDTTATFSEYGSYTLQLQVTSSGKISYDYCVINYGETATVLNVKPVVDAGEDQSITLPSDATLDGTVTDDGLPNPPGQVTTLWTKQSGPGIVVFDDPLSVDTTVDFSQAGTYVLRLGADDGGLMAYDELIVDVTGGGSEPNIPAAPPVTQWYRIMQHFHTTNSDGAEDPNLMFGYAIMGENGLFDGACVTDHDFITDANQWVTGTFLAINGVEVTEGKSHVNSFGTLEAPGPLVNPGLNLQEHIDRALAAGGLPMICHPKWTIEYSGQQVTNLVDQIINSTGCQMLEVFNHYCEDYWGWGFSESIWDQVLSAGKKMYAVAGDDAHGLGRAGFTSIYIGAEELTVDALKDAFDYGHFYACRSTDKWHPGIKLLDYEVTGSEEDDTITIVADANADNIKFIGYNGTILDSVDSNSAVYTIDGYEKYVRARITNSDGDYTWTQPVFITAIEPNDTGPRPIDDYQGYDTVTEGGKGGEEVWVTNLNDSGAGSLRWALEQCSGLEKHVVKFQVGGCIGLTAPLPTGSFTTIAGETAPWPGITLVSSGAYRCFEINNQHVIIRHLRIRNFPGEGIQVFGNHNILIDRCSITGTGDGACDFNPGNHYTFSRNLVGGVVEAHRAYGATTSYHHNLYAWNNRRQPKIYESGPEFDFRNNIVEYWTNTGTNIMVSTNINIINNFYGPPAPLESWGVGLIVSGDQNVNIYVNGNYCFGDDIDAKGTTSTPNTEPNVTTVCLTGGGCDPQDLKDDVKGDVGARPWDAIDLYYLGGGGLNPPAPPTPGSGSGGEDPNDPNGGSGTWNIIDADYYVDKATGSDSGPGTILSPFATIGKAAAEATTPGDVVVVRGGDQTYYEDIEFQGIGTAAEPITFVVDPGSGKATIDGGGALTGTIYSRGADYIVIDGFTITNARYGIYLYGDGVDGWIIKNCEITGNDADGIYVRDGDNHSIYNNIIYSNGGSNSGVYVLGSCLNVDVTNCDVYEGKYGIFYNVNASGDILNCIVTDASINGVRVENSTVTVKYSDVWNNGTNYYGITAGTGCISSNPLWADPDNGDFTLGDGSGCIGTASDGGDMGYRGTAYAPGNLPPVVNTDDAIEITLPASATLDATVTDDGQPDPPGSVTTTWTKQSGPGTVTFGNASAVDTTASFSTDGEYILRLTADDDELTSYDEIIVTVNPSGVGWSESADYYVDGMSGDDTNAGTSSAPFATIGKAVDTASEGDTVLVWGNQTYTENLEFDTSGSSGNPITFKRDPNSGEATIDGDDALTGVIYSTSADYIVIDGFTLTGARYGVYLYGDGVDNWTIQNCRIEYNQLEGIYIRSGDDHTIFNNLVYKNGSNNKGIYIYNSATNCDITQCNVYGHKYGIAYNLSCTGDITDCIVTEHVINGIESDGGSTITITYSDVWDNSTNYVGCSAGTGCISSDPDYVDAPAGDFELETGSPCIEAASDSGDIGYRSSDMAL